MSAKQKERATVPFKFLRDFIQYPSNKIVEAWTVHMPFLFIYGLVQKKIQYSPQVYNVSTEERKVIAQTTLKKNIPLNTSEE